MRIQLVKAKSYYQARAMAPWGKRFIQVQGGYKVFESAFDYIVWNSKRRIEHASH